jgi:hypothetical protein
MQFEFTWVEPALVICRIFGSAETEDFATLEEAMISNPKFRPSMGRVIDIRELDVSSLSSGDIERFAELIADLKDDVRTGRLALVAGSDSPLKFGFARMFEAFYQPRARVPIRVFDVFDDALAWAGESPSKIPAGDEAGRAPEGVDSRTLSDPP